MQVSAFKGANYYIVEVIAFVLKHLKSKFEEELEMSHMQDEGQTRILKASDFTWVITVPAIWDDKGKQMMREAAYTVSYYVHIMFNELFFIHRLDCLLTQLLPLILSLQSHSHLQDVT